MANRDETAAGIFSERLKLKNFKDLTIKSRKRSYEQSSEFTRSIININSQSNLVSHYFNIAIRVNHINEYITITYGTNRNVYHKSLIATICHPISSAKVQLTLTQCIRCRGSLSFNKKWIEYKNQRNNLMIATKLGCYKDKSYNSKLNSHLMMQLNKKLNNLKWQIQAK